MFESIYITPRLDCTVRCMHGTPSVGTVKQHAVMIIHHEQLLNFVVVYYIHASNCYRIFVKTERKRDDATYII